MMMMMMTVTFDKVLPSRPEDTVRCQQPQLSAPFPQKTKIYHLRRPRQDDHQHGDHDDRHGHCDDQHGHHNDWI